MLKESFKTNIKRYKKCQEMHINGCNSNLCEPYGFVYETWANMRKAMKSFVNIYISLHILGQERKTNTITEQKLFFENF